MIRPICNHCTKELETYGGLIFSPPETYPDGTPHKDVKKIHICASCYRDLEEWIMTPQGGINAMISVCQQLLKLDGTVDMDATIRDRWEPLVEKARQAITYKGGGTIRP